MATSRPHHQFSLLLAILLLTSHGRTQTVSIQSITGYLVQRKCVQQCIIGRHDDGNAAVLVEPIGCSSPYQNACMCNTGRAAVWTTALSACVDKYCNSKKPDFSAALSLYNGYCATNLALVTSAATVSLTGVPEYMNARSCVKNCMLSRPPNGDENMAMNLQCAGYPMSRTYDECFCRKDLATDANSFLTSCVNRWCDGNAADVSSAVSLYGNYCDSARAAATGGGGGTPSSETGATPGSGSGGSEYPTSLHVTFRLSQSTNHLYTGTPSQTGGPNGGNKPNDDNKSSTPSTGMIVGIVIGLVAFGTAALLIFLHIRKSKHPKPGPSDPKVIPGQGDYSSIPSNHGPSPQSNQQPFIYVYPQPQPHLSPPPVMTVPGPASHNWETSSNLSTEERVHNYNVRRGVQSWVRGQERGPGRMPADLMSNAGTVRTRGTRGGDDDEISVSPDP